MYICVMDRQGKKLVHTQVKNNDFKFFLKLVEPYKHDLTVCCECMFGWYWLADACQAAGLKFVLAHALYVHLIHGGKNKNDRIDSEKLTHLLRSNLIPQAFVYPADMRPVRALLRQRIFFVWQRSELLARVHSHQLTHNRTPPKQTRRVRDTWEEQVLAAKEHPLRLITLKNELAMIRHFDQQIPQLETELLCQTKQLAGQEFALLRTVPGIGEILGLTILYEMGTIERFPTVKDFLSYCRLVKGTVTSAGKIRLARRQARQPLPALGLWRSGRHRQARPLPHRTSGSTARSQARETELALCFSVSFVRKKGSPDPSRQIKTRLGSNGEVEF
jgi:transposase